jgi:hypothetical protein
VSSARSCTCRRGGQALTPVLRALRAVLSVIARRCGPMIGTGGPMIGTLIWYFTTRGFVLLRDLVPSFRLSAT